MANSSTTHLLPGAPQTLLSATGKTSYGLEGGTGTTALEGAWFRLNPEYGRLWFTSKLTGTSVGSTATATISIQGSNDGTNAASTDLITFSAQSLTTDTVVLSGPVPSSLNGAYAYVRANLTSLTTATAGSSEGATSAGSTNGTAANVEILANTGIFGRV